MSQINREVTWEAPATHHILDKEFVGLLKVGDTTPSVLNLNKLKAVNTGPVTITYFDDSFDGHEIAILGDGHTTVQYNPVGIVTNTLADKLLTAKQVFRFTRYDSVWYEDSCCVESPPV